MNGKKSRVPGTRISRLARLSLAAGQMAVGGLAEGARRLRSDAPITASDLFLTAGNAEKLTRHLASMRGAAMKIGQMLSMESADVLPPEFANALAMLRGSGHTMPHKQLRGVLGRELGKGWEALFSEFDMEPIAAASIGQVHRVTTADGRDLALKIQFPGVAKSIDSDVDNLAVLLKLFQLFPGTIDVEGIIAEAKRQLHQEADYLAEAGHMRDFGRFLQNDERFVVPRVHSDLTSKRILAMDYVGGVPLESLGDEDVAQGLRDEIGTLLEELVFREMFEFNAMQTDPNFANYLFQVESRRVVLLDFGATKRLDPKFAQKYARIARALVDDDYEGARRCAVDIGYLGPDNSEEHVDRVLQMIALMCEPILWDEIYDFGEADLFVRGRDLSMEMMYGDWSEFRTPPPDTMFLHRKLVGSFMLCHRIGARLNVQQLIKPFLPANAAIPG